MNNTLIIKTKNLTKTFLSKEVIKGCNMSVEKGTIYGFLGVNGAGKRPILLFSYPVSRQKIVLSKLSVVCGFTIISMVISNLIAFLIFGVFLIKRVNVMAVE